MSEASLRIGGVEADLLAEIYDTPVYVYDADVIRSRYRALVAAIEYPRTRVCYSCKANGNPEILRLMLEIGADGIDAVSLGEVHLALGVGFPADRISITNPGLSVEDLETIRELGIHLKADSISQLRRWRRLGAGPVSLRINPGAGFGHHEHVVTGGPNSKFGIYLHELDEARRLAGDVVGLHQHAGCGALDPDTFIQTAEPLFRVAFGFAELEELNLGGGLGVPYRPGERPLDLDVLGRKLSRRFETFCREYGRNLALALEPGRYIVAESGFLLSRVQAVKDSGSRRFAIVDTGFNHLLRPILYDAYHAVVNVSNGGGPPERIWVGGNVCESGDLLTGEREVAAVREGDLLAILNVGAYGYAMSSDYTGAARPAEVMVDGGWHRPIRARSGPPVAS